jgi:hypothetical protein
MIRFKHPVSPPILCRTCCRERFGLTSWMAPRDLTPYVQDSAATLRFDPPRPESRISLARGWVDRSVTWQLQQPRRPPLQHPPQPRHAELRRFPRPLRAGRWQYSRWLSASRSTSMRPTALTLEDGVLKRQHPIKNLNFGRNSAVDRSKQSPNPKPALRKSCKPSNSGLNWTIPGDHCTLQLQLTIEPSPS